MVHIRNTRNSKKTNTIPQFNPKSNHEFLRPLAGFMGREKETGETERGKEETKEGRKGGGGKKIEKEEKKKAGGRGQ